MKLSAAIGLLGLGLAANAQATVLTGDIYSKHGIHWGYWEPYTDGTGAQALALDWDSRSNTSVWLYGSESRGGWRDDNGVLYSNNVDIAVVGSIDPLTISDASQFNYTSSYTHAAVGQTVFFRESIHYYDGSLYTGYYGAWVINDKVTGTCPPPCDYGADVFLDVTWYFQDDKSANFTSQVPESSTALLVAMGVALLSLQKHLKATR